MMTLYEELVALPARDAKHGRALDAALDALDRDPVGAYPEAFQLLCDSREPAEPLV